MNLRLTDNSGSRDASPSISADGLSLFFYSYRGDSRADLYVTTRPTTSDPWGHSVYLGPIVHSGWSWEGKPDISADGCKLFFCADFSGGYGSPDLYVTTRPTTNDPWGKPVNLGPNVNTSLVESSPSISHDGYTLYFCRGRSDGPATFDLWQVTINPIVDLNGDRIVDSADMCIMVDHWGTDEPAYDIGPMPWGDGIVDVQDLIVLAEHLFKDYRLIGHWMLDETEGRIAADSAGGYDATLHGDPTWQPEGGMVEGALQFDGIDDYLSTPFVLNPAEGQFSVFVWIKGGTPGQLILSQVYGAHWLSVDVSEGNLMTELNSQDSAALLSQAIITDGAWHRIGFVWDGSQRILYVDDVEVTRDVDALSGLKGSYGGFYIGAGTAREPGTFWSGLIDDVRIYNRALIPTESRDTSKEVHVDADDAGSEVELEQGWILVITLESNPTTGYRWEVVETQESILQQMGEAEFKPSDTGEPPLVGAGGWEIFRFKAISAGQMTLQLVYHRPWEEGVEPVNTFSIQVVVN